MRPKEFIATNGSDIDNESTRQPQQGKNLQVAGQIISLIIYPPRVLKIKID